MKTTADWTTGCILKDCRLCEPERTGVRLRVTGIWQTAQDMGWVGKDNTIHLKFQTQGYDIGKWDEVTTYWISHQVEQKHCVNTNDFLFVCFFARCYFLMIFDFSTILMLLVFLVPCNPFLFCHAGELVHPGHPGWSVGLSQRSAKQHGQLPMPSWKQSRICFPPAGCGCALWVVYTVDFFYLFI